MCPPVQYSKFSAHLGGSVFVCCRTGNVVARSFLLKFRRCFHISKSELPINEEIREKEGKDWVVNQVIAETKDLIKAGQKRIILDGVYSWTEYKILKKEFLKSLTFVAVVVDKNLRYERVAKRPDRSFDARAIRERDRSEIENLEKGGPIAAADYYILNNRI